VLSASVSPTSPTNTRAPLSGKAISAALAATRDAMLERARRDMAAKASIPPSVATPTRSGPKPASTRVERALTDGDLQRHCGRNPVTVLSLTASYELPVFGLIPDGSHRNAAPATCGRVNVSYGNGTGDGVPVYQMAQLAPADGLDGPALLRSDYLTCLIDKGWSMRVSDNQDLILEEA
jgi:hypothetical protein